MRDLSTDVLIVGGGTGGTAAALACARAGVACIMTEPTDWVGGQLTAQGVPPDENQWVEEFGATRSYQAIRTAVRAWHQRQPGLVESARTRERLNPGGGWVSRLCAPPSVWHEVLAAELRSARPTPTLLLHHEPVSAETTGDCIDAVSFRQIGPQAGGEGVTIRARLVLDATETGDLLELAGVEHAVGAEHRDALGELHGRDDFDPSRRYDWLDQQAVSWCFALEHRPGEDHTIPTPQNWFWWRDYVPEMTPAWCGPLFSWTVPSHSPPGKRTFRFVPWPDEPHPGEWEMWRYRRIVDRALWRTAAPGASGAGGGAPPDVALINMVQMDCWRLPLLGVSAPQRQAALDLAREQSLAFLYWMQTEAPRHDSESKRGYPGLKLRGDELGSADGLAKAAYIREPRRLIARTIVHEGHIGTEQRRRDGLATPDRNWDATPYGTAHPFEDSVGIGHYMIDLHPSCAGRNNVYVPAAPFRIPMGALIPVRVRNLLAAGKCLGVTHVTNGAYRMHHVEWNVGESAGALAAWCVRANREPHEVHQAKGLLGAVQQVLDDQGVRRAWPWETP